MYIRRGCTEIPARSDRLHTPQCDARRANNSGFTLIEVMIGLAVLVVLTLVFAACVPLARKSAKMNGQYSQAISLCQHKIDQCRAFGFGRINYDELEGFVIDATPSTQPWSFKAIDDVEEYLPNSTATLRISKDPGMSDDEMKVTATVTWRTTTYESKTNRASLSAVITNVE